MLALVAPVKNEVQIPYVLLARKHTLAKSHGGSSFSLHEDFYQSTTIAIVSDLYVKIKTLSEN